MPQSGDIDGEQSLSVSVNGPDDVNTLFITTGQMICRFAADDETGHGAYVNDDFSATLSSLSLTPGQFKNSIATASLAGIDGYFYGGIPGANGSGWTITSVRADLNAAMGQV